MTYSLGGCLEMEKKRKSEIPGLKPRGFVKGFYSGVAIFKIRSLIARKRFSQFFNKQELSIEILGYAVLVWIPWFNVFPVDLSFFLPAQNLI
jgi:hypothetical protein